MTARIALFRGVNVGGSGKLPMGELRALAAELGFEQPRTLLQSGNLVFRSPLVPQALEALIEARIAERFALDREVMVRTPTEWAELIAANPFADEAMAEPNRLIVMVLKGDPDAAGLAALRAFAGPERIEARGRALYIHYPHGQGVSKLPASPAWKRLKTVATGRNWNTVLKLARMARDFPTISSGSYASHPGAEK
jgi:uncharacterized protein (DUF1697 family)